MSSPTDLEIIEEYLKRTGDTHENLNVGFYHFGLSDVIEHIKKANKLNRKVKYYMAKNDWKYRDRISVRYIPFQKKSRTPKDSKPY